MKNNILFGFKQALFGITLTLLALLSFPSKLLGISTTGFAPHAIPQAPNIKLNDDSFLKEIKRYSNKIILPQTKTEERHLIETPYEKLEKKEKEMIQKAQQGYLASQGIVINEDKNDEKTDHGINNNQIKKHTLLKNKENIANSNSTEKTTLPEGIIINLMQNDNSDNQGSDSSSDSSSGSKNSEKNSGSLFSNIWRTTKGTIAKLILGDEEEIEDDIDESEGEETDGEDEKKSDQKSAEEILDEKLKEELIAKRINYRTINSIDDLTNLSEEELSKNTGLIIDNSIDFTSHEEETANTISSLLDKEHIEGLKFSLNTKKLADVIFPAIIEKIKNLGKYDRLVIDLRGSKLGLKEIKMYAKISSSLKAKKHLHIHGFDFGNYIIKSSIPKNLINNYLQNNFPFLREKTDEYDQAKETILEFLKKNTQTLEDQESKSSISISKFDPELLLKKAIEEILSFCYQKYFSEELAIDISSSSIKDINESLEKQKNASLDYINDSPATPSLRADTAYEMLVLYKLVAIYAEKIKKSRNVDIEREATKFLILYYGLKLSEPKEAKDEIKHGKKLLTIDLKNIYPNNENILDYVGVVINKIFQGTGHRWLFITKKRKEKTLRAGGILMALRITFDLLGRNLIEEVIKEKQAVINKTMTDNVHKKSAMKSLEHFLKASYFQGSNDLETFIQLLNQFILEAELKQNTQLLNAANKLKEFIEHVSKFILAGLDIALEEHDAPKVLLNNNTNENYWQKIMKMFRDFEPEESCHQKLIKILQAISPQYTKKTYEFE